jgi:hypothetical protein
MYMYLEFIFFLKNPCTWNLELEDSVLSNVFCCTTQAATSAQPERIKDSNHGPLPQPVACGLGPPWVVRRANPGGNSRGPTRNRADTFPAHLGSPRSRLQQLLSSAAVSASHCTKSNLFACSSCQADDKKETICVMVR